MITEKEFEQRRENFERQWYPTVGGTRQTWVEEVIVPFFTRDWIAYAARAEPNDSYALMFAKIFMRRRRFEDLTV